MFLQPLAPIVIPVALLTGRVYRDGLGGLQAVLFYFCRPFRNVRIFVGDPPKSGQFYRQVNYS